MVRIMVVFGCWIAVAQPLAAQARENRDSARVGRLRTDTILKLQSRRDSARQRNPADAARLREEQRRRNEAMADDARRRVPFDERLRQPPVIDTTAGPDSLPPIPRIIITPPRADSARLREGPALRTDSAARMRPVSRPRGIVMRLRNQPGAPAFCDSGAGHPLYGREWCHERGFRLGDVWQRRSVKDISVQRPPSGGRTLDRAQIAQRYGNRLAQWINEARTGLQLADSVTARWVSTPDGGSILGFQVGSTQIAEVIDRNRDGRAEVVWIARAR